MTNTNEDKINSITKKYEEIIRKLEQKLEVQEIEENEKAKSRELEHHLGKKTNPFYTPKSNEERITELEHKLKVTIIEEKEKAKLRKLEYNLVKESNPDYAHQQNMTFIMFVILSLLSFLILAVMVFF